MADAYLYAFADVAFEDAQRAGWETWAIAAIAFEEPGRAGQETWAIAAIAFEEPGRAGWEVWGWLRVTFQVSPNTPPEWTLYDGFTALGVFRDIGGG